MFDTMIAGSEQNTDKRPLRKRQIYIHVETTSPYTAKRTTQAYSDGNSIVFSLNDLQEIIDFDLDNTFTSIGDQLFKQFKGCPMGGLLSAFYANVTCAYHENCFMNTHPQLASQIEGIRQMDDLLLFIVSTNPTTAKTDIKKMTQKLQHEIYKGGLTVELQEPDTVSDTGVMHKFAGHEVHTRTKLSDIYSTTPTKINSQCW